MIEQQKQEKSREKFMSDLMHMRNMEIEQAESHAIDSPKVEVIFGKSMAEGDPFFK